MGDLELAVDNATNATGSTQPLTFDATAGPYPTVLGPYGLASTVTCMVLAGPGGTTGVATEALTSIFTGPTTVTLKPGTATAPPAAGSSSFPYRYQIGEMPIDNSYSLENIFTFTTSSVGDSVSGQAFAIAGEVPEPTTLHLLLAGVGTLALASRLRRRNRPHICRAGFDTDQGTPSGACGRLARRSAFGATPGMRIMP